MKFASLFAGIGGFDLGLERAGMSCTLQVELNPQCRHVLKHHFPNARRQKDVSKTKGKSLRTRLVAGGFPCQDLSVAGKRAGLAGKRSGLFFQFVRILAEARPRWCVVENVPGLLSSNGGRDMGTVLGALGQLGYGWAYRVLDAQHFGVAQRRKRVFIVGCLGSRSGAARVLFEPESLSGDPPARPETGQETAVGVVKGAAIGRKPEAGPQRGETLDDGSCFTLNCTETHAVGVCLNPYRTRADNEDKFVEGFKRDGVDDAVTANEPPKDRPLVVSAYINPRITRNQRKKSSNQVEIKDGSRSDCLQSDGTGDGHGNGWNSNYLAGGMAIRRLTPTEYLRLQAFPDDWLDLDPPLSDSHKYHMTGNAVCTAVAYWLGCRIMEVEAGRNPNALRIDLVKYIRSLNAGKC